jgi:hypothetical protein
VRACHYGRVRSPGPTTEAAGASGWASRRLGIRLSTARRASGVALEELVGVAVRRNPRRAQLLVSTVLGKHLPTDPDLVRGAALLLGRLVTRALEGGSPVLSGSEGEALLRAIHGEPGAAAALVADLPTGGPSPQDLLVIGYAETATALGQTVADALGADLCSSTRRDVPSVAPSGGFEEEHSHATSHRLLPDDAQLLRAGTVVLVDDELSTGTTVLHTVALLERIRPGRRYVVATLVDLRPEGSAAGLRAAAGALGGQLQVVALADGGVDLPDDVLDRAAALLRARPADERPAPGAAGEVRRIEGAWPATLRHHGRHGFRSGDRERFEPALAGLAETVAAHLRGGDVHVLGTEELMYLPQRLAGRLAALLPAVRCTSSATTRSPVVAVDEPGYPIRTAIAFPAHDDPDDGPGERFAYNLGAAGRFGTIVLVVDERGSTPELDGPAGLVRRLAALAPQVLVVVLPDGAPGPLEPEADAA